MTPAKSVDHFEPNAPYRSFSSHSLASYLQVAKRRRLGIFLSVAVPVLFAVALSVFQDQQYSATASVTLNRQNLASAITDVPDTDTIGTNIERIVQTQADVARSPATVERVLRAIPHSGYTLRSFLEHSSVKPKPNADLISFTTSSSDPQLAIRLANAYASEYVAYKQQIDVAPLAEARKRLLVRVKQLRRKGSGATENSISSLLAKDQELGTLEALQTSNAVVSVRAFRAHTTAPQPVKYITLGLLAGIALALLITQLLEALDTKVQSVEEVEERTGMPILAQIPQLRSDIGHGLVALEDPTGADAEAFRILRTSFEFATIDRLSKLVMLTSAIEGEGKTTTICNLAVTMARGGSRVSLIDLDLRRPSLGKRFKLNTALGFTDVLRGAVDLDEAWVQIDLGEKGSHLDGSPGDSEIQGYLQVLGAGTLPPDPGELLAKPSVSDLLARIGEESDIVLIDAPPVLPVSDAMTLTAKVDTIIIVTRLRVIRRKMLDDLRRALVGAPSGPIGVVVTGSGKSSLYSYGYTHPSSPRRIEVAQSR